MRPADIRDWVARRRFAAEREVEERAARVPPPEVAFRRGLEMIELAARLHGWPIPEDELDAAQDRAGYERWRRLRRIS